MFKICKFAKYEHYEKSNFIFREGDKSNDKFYVIIKGTVSILLSNDSNIFIQENLKDRRVSGG